MKKQIFLYSGLLFAVLMTPFFLKGQGIDSTKNDSFSNIVVSFDKLISAIPAGQIIGEMRGGLGFKSKLFYDERYIQISEPEQILEKELQKRGFLINSSSDLFSETKTQKNPQILIGAKITNMDIRSRASSSSTVKEMDCKIGIEWQVFNVKKSKIILTLSTKAEIIDPGPIDASGTLYRYYLTKSFNEAAKKMVFSSEFTKAIQDYMKKPLPYSKGNEVLLNKVDTPAYKDYSKMIGGSIKSVVTVKVDGGHGSGFIISEDGLIVTNYHVLEGSSEIKVEFNAGFTLPAVVWSYNEEFDVALIKVDGSGFKPLLMKNDEETNIGDEVIAIGTPADVSLGQTVTKGIVSGMREFGKKKLYQTDASLNGGNSGGPLLNMKGEVIGINSYKLKGVGIDGLNFAIPTDVAIEKLHITFK